ncbi:MAG: ABC transporter permease [Lachnospiraceae bacterium]
MIENIRMAFQGIWSHKMRSFLTMLGIIIGIAAIIAIVSTIKGTNEQIKENLVGSGENTVKVELNQGDDPIDLSYQSIPSGVPMVSEQTLKSIKKIDGATSVATYSERCEYDGGIYYLNNTISGGTVLGVSQNYMDTCDYIMQKGRNFTEDDYKKFRKVAILDEDSAYNLFQGEEPVGKTIELRKEPFVVIGVITKKKEFEPKINSMKDYDTYAQENSGKIFIPDADWPIIYQFDEPQNVVVGVESTDDMTTVGKKTEDLLNACLTVNENNNVKYKAQDLLEKAREQQELSESTNSMLIWIAGISLLVGGIGVMNIMLVSVTERTQEIGLKKAIGAKKSSILLQFLTEAAVLTSIGGAVGVAVGIGLAQIISRVSDTPVAISPTAAVISVVFSMLIGVIFGMLPSYKAANLNPIDALRHE